MVGFVLFEAVDRISWDKHNLNVYKSRMLVSCVKVDTIRASRAA